MTAQEARTHIQYTAWASRKMLDAVESLPESERTKENGVSHKSILGTLTHTYWADRVWYIRAVDSTMTMPQPGSSLTLDQLKQEWNDLLDRWQAWADKLTDSDLERVVHFTMLNGSPGAMPLVALLLHVVNHATLHRGQVMGMIRQLGIAPPATDFLFFYRDVVAAK